MNPIELAKECGAATAFGDHCPPGLDEYIFTVAALSTFVQRIREEAYDEAADAAEHVITRDKTANLSTRELIMNDAAEEIAAAIHSLKPESPEGE